MFLVVRGRLAGVIGLLVVAVVVAGCASSRPEKKAATTAGSASATQVQIQLVLTANGDPALGDNVEGRAGSPKMGWLACRPKADRCTPITRGVTRPGPISQYLVPGRTPSGWSFEAVAHRNGRTYRARSSIWLGRVRPVTAARISGMAVVGAQIHPIAGSWSGGWSGATVHQLRGGSLLAGGPDPDQLSIEACRNRTGRNCVNLSPQKHSCLYSPGPVRVPKRVTGWYLFAFDQRTAPGGLCAEPGFSSPEAEPTVRLGPLATRSQPLGRVRR